MADKIVFIKYSFLFNTSDTWQHLYQFENSLAKYFDTIGFEANIIKGIDGQNNERILYIKKKETPPVIQKEIKSTSVKNMVDKLRKP